MNKKTTIRVSGDTQRKLKELALTDGESYENIILRLLQEHSKK
ncbi:hypothetical protein [Methanobrevibacter sp. DSM 116169]